MDKHYLTGLLQSVLKEIEALVNQFDQNVDDRDSDRFYHLIKIEGELRQLLNKEAFSQQEAYNYLISHPDVSQVVGRRGYFALGDANAIYGGSDYRGEIVLVEVTDTSRYVHWGFRFFASKHPEVKATIFS